MEKIHSDQITRTKRELAGQLDAWSTERWINHSVSCIIYFYDGITRRIYERELLLYGLFLTDQGKLEQSWDLIIEDG